MYSIVSIDKQSEYWINKNTKCKIYHVFQINYIKLYFTDKPFFQHTCAAIYRPILYRGRPLKNHKNIGFLSNTGPDPQKNHKATKPVFNVGPPSAGRCIAQHIMVFGTSLPSSTKKIVVKIGATLKKLPASAHEPSGLVYL